MTKYALTIGGPTGETVHLIETSGNFLTFKQVAKAMVHLTTHWGISIESVTFHTKHGNLLPMENKAPTAAKITASVVWYGDDDCDDDCWIRLDKIENGCFVD